MSDLLLKQVIFTRYLGRLLDEFFEETITIGEAWRSSETCALYAKEGKGISHSCHELRLAIDLNLFVKGVLSNEKKDYEMLADYWKELPQLYPDAIEIETCWGGDFNSLCDMYHFSILHNGVK